MRNLVILAIVVGSASVGMGAGKEVPDRQFPLLPATTPTSPATQPATRPALTDNVLDAKGLDYAIEKLNAPMRETDPLSPQESLKQFKPSDGLAVDLIAAEPDIRQPLCINFDERGRMWVVQYIQYPFPAGLKVVEYDRYIRAKFDKVPSAPPNHAAGRDVISILEDVDGDGSFRKHNTFVSGLSIATSALPGRGGRKPGELGRFGKSGSDYGVWVMNPPYLLFYPDADRDDVPDADPIVHLSGFGLEDTHAVASNLTWGPDGWLYGTQGSTCTAKVKTHLGDTSKTTDFLGQAVWRYHPERHVFEIFAEGGGNTFGLEFDDAGRCFSGTNNGNLRGMHYVQGGYGKKTWGKHGPLTNPYAFGFFEHMPHTGYGTRLTHTFVVYGGTLMPQYRGKIIAPNSLTSRIQLTRLEPWGSTYKTVEEPHLMTSDDGWFRPVDLKVGPDGAIYIADFYEKRISHVDPRDTWERGSGRIWRLRPADWKPKTVAMDLWTERAEKLVERLKSANRWERWTARRMLGERDTLPDAVELAFKDDQAASPLEALLAIHAARKMTDPLARAGLQHADPVVRAWTVRLLTDIDQSGVSDTLFNRLREMASYEVDPQVRSQLASSSRRLRPDQGFLLASDMLAHGDDIDDPYIPLLLWWTYERLATQVSGGIVEQFARPAVWESRLARDIIAPRLARRYAAEPTAANQEILARLLEAAPSDAHRKILLAGIREALVGGNTPQWSPSLLKAFVASGDPELSLRAGEVSAIPSALQSAADEKADAATRIRLIEALSLTGKASVGDALLKIVKGTRHVDVRLAAITGLGRCPSPSLADGLVETYPKLNRPEMKSAAIATLLSRPDWIVRLVRGVETGVIPRADLSNTDLTRLRQFEDPAVVALVERVFGKAVRATDAEKAVEVERITRLATTGVGDAIRGKAIYATRCGACHTLNGVGGQIGPDLTTYDRRNATDMAINIVDPSAYIREEFASFRVKTRGDEVYVGLIVERSGDRLTLVDAAQQKTTIAKGDIADERAMKQSLMPEGLLAGLSDQEVRDLFKYLATP